MLWHMQDGPLERGGGGGACPKAFGNVSLLRFHVGIFNHVDIFNPLLYMGTNLAVHCYKQQLTSGVLTAVLVKIEGLCNIMPS